MAASSDDPTTFVLALSHLDGVGRVTAGRLATHFAHYDDLRSHSREEVFLRIKGVPHAEKIAERLFEDEPMQTALAEAETKQEALRERGVEVLAPRSEAWPARLDDLALRQRPLLLWAYGPPEVLDRSSVSLLAHPPMEEAPFERAQALAQHLAADGAVPVLGAQSGFDVAIARRAADDRVPVILVAACGLGQLPRRMRPIASQVVRTGGLLISPFAMQHGPFDHDDRERAQVQAALADACVFAPSAAGTPEGQARAWATEAGRPTFVLTDDPPSGAKALTGSEDFAAVTNVLRSTR